MIVFFLISLPRFAHVFMMDTGASVKGDITGHTKCINTCDWKPTRPFRIVTGAEDNKVAFYEGPPFKFKCTRGVSIFRVCNFFFIVNNS